MTAIRPRLVLFARYPEPGSAKTRLIPAIGPAGAAAVHRRLTERTLALLSASAAPVELHYTGATAVRFREWLGTRVMLAPQVAGGLGERLMAAIDPAPVIFFGADTPDLAPEHIAAAIAALEDHEVVIGPADDGGYFLIGMRTPRPALFADMAWSTAAVFPETLARLDAIGIAPVILPGLGDCDRPEDLARWPWLTA